MTAGGAALGSGAASDPDVLDTVYSSALRRGHLPADDVGIPVELGIGPKAYRAAVSQLLELKLLQPSELSGRPVWLAVNAELAEMQLLSPMTAQVRAQQMTISRVQGYMTNFRALHAQHRDATALSSGEVELIGDAEQLAEVLRQTAYACDRRFRAFLLAGPTDLTWVADMSARGVSVELAVPHGVRNDLRCRPFIRRIRGDGGELRTVSRPAREVLVFDEVAVCRNAEGAGGALISHAPTVDVLRDMLGSLWDFATQWDEENSRCQDIADDLHRTILSMLAAGLTDETVAHRLRMSVRTCRRHIAAAFDSLRAVSRFQAGVLVGAAGIVEPRPCAGGDTVAKHQISITPTSSDT